MKTSQTGRVFLRLTVFAFLLANLLLVRNPPAGADPGPPNWPGGILRVLLIGDSYTAGNGSRTQGGLRAFYGPEDCLRSYANWGSMWATKVHQTTGLDVYLENHACPAGTRDAPIRG